jgi:DNA-binding MarR family transcriptional regulator
MSSKSELSDADYQRLLGFRTGIRRFIHWSDEQALAIGLTPAQHQLLLAVRGHDDPLGPTVGDVAKYLLLRHHSAVGLVDRAEAAGFVARHTDPTDQRVVRLRLTPLGTRRLRQLATLHFEELNRLSPRVRSLWSGIEGTQ